MNKYKQVAQKCILHEFLKWFCLDDLLEKQIFKTETGSCNFLYNVEIYLFPYLVYGDIYSMKEVEVEEIRIKM